MEPATDRPPRWLATPRQLAFAAALLVCAVGVIVAATLAATWIVDLAPDEALAGFAAVWLVALTILVLVHKHPEQENQP